MTTPMDNRTVPTAPASLTTAITLRLANPAALQRGLDLLGLRWIPHEVDDSATAEEGLYCWVAGIGAKATPLTAACLYIGVGTGDSGWRGRTKRERSWVAESADHGHGMAMHRLSAEVIGGSVTYVQKSLEWLDETVTSSGALIIRDYLADLGSLRIVRVAEAIAIRLAIHLGDTGAPVNATGAGAWGTDRAEDWAGFAAAKRLLQMDSRLAEDQTRH